MHEEKPYNAWTDTSARIRLGPTLILFVSAAIVLAVSLLVRGLPAFQGASRASSYGLALAKGLGAGAGVVLFWAVVCLVLIALDRRRDREPPN